VKLAVWLGSSTLTVAGTGLPPPAGCSWLLPKRMPAACSTMLLVGCSTSRSMLTLPSKRICAACGVICTR